MEIEIIRFGAERSFTHLIREKQLALELARAQAKPVFLDLRNFAFQIAPTDTVKEIENRHHAVRAQYGDHFEGVVFANGKVEPMDPNVTIVLNNDGEKLLVEALAKRPTTIRTPALPAQPGVS
jgi:hypothetical protein